MASHENNYLTLVIGGARSGKSNWAEGYAKSMAEGGENDLLYLATACADDEEMRERIALHQSQRGDRWSTLEVPLDLPDALRENSKADRIVLVDCLTLWLSNLMAAERDLKGAFDALLAALQESNGHVILVSNEVGLGIVPMNKLARDFRDHAGRLNQAVARMADVAVFMAAGLPMMLKAPDGWQPPHL